MVSHNYAAKISDQDLKLNDKTRGLGPTGRRPVDHHLSSALRFQAAFDRCTSVSVSTCPRCVCVCCSCVCELFFCVFVCVCVCEYVSVSLHLCVVCITCAWEIVFVLYMMNTCQHLLARMCMCCVRANVLHVLCQCVLVYMCVGMFVILLSVLQSFFANCNTYIMMWYTWGKKRWFFLYHFFCFHRLNNSNSMELSYGMISYMYRKAKRPIPVHLDIFISIFTHKHTHAQTHTHTHYSFSDPSVLIYIRIHIIDAYVSIQVNAIVK